MTSNDDNSPIKPSVRFDENIYTDADVVPGSPSASVNRANDTITNSPVPRQRPRSKSSILKRRPNTINMADAPPVIMSDEGLKGGRVSPFTNFGLFFSLTIRSFGIVFGDIGTSPLYVVKTIFDTEPEKRDVIGAISLIVWSLIVVVSIKYAIFILMADNHGEGGPFALCSLLTGQTSRIHFRLKQFVSVGSILAACLLIGDGALTPAVSILSALEGMVVAKPSLSSWTVRISVIIIIGLFLVQYWGSSRIGICFGPVMILWFIVLAIVGIWRITFQPSILRAFDPWEALHYLIRTKKTGFYQIGSIFLAVTGLEALYADLGHFGRWPIRFAWFAVVFPSVLLNYLGQGALLISNPEFLDNPFYHALPSWALWPVLVLSVIATAIASQAIITGSFSLVSQAVAMGFCVPTTVIHTSDTIIGHIYVPVANYFLLALTIAVTVGFQTSDNITDAYGVTVGSVMVITTILYMMVLRWTWSKPIWLVSLFGIFLIVDLYTLAAIYATKIGSGGWVAFIIALVLFIFSFCWYYGNIRLRHYLSKHSKKDSLDDLSTRLGLTGLDHVPSPIVSEEELDGRQHYDDDDSSSDTDDNNNNVQEMNKTDISLVRDVRHSIPIEPVENNEILKSNPVITPGVGCFLTLSRKHTPYVFENFLNRMHAHQEVLIFLKLEYARVPKIDQDQRLIVRAFGTTIFYVTVTFGYAETNINLFNILYLAGQLYDIPIGSNQANITFFLPDVSIQVNTRGWKSWLRRWPLYIYSILKNLNPGIPLNLKSVPESTIKVGILAEL